MPKSNKDKFKKEVILPSVIFFFPFVFIILHLTAIMAQMDCNLAEALLQLKPHTKQITKGIWASLKFILMILN